MATAFLILGFLAGMIFVIMTIIVFQLIRLQKGVKIIIMNQEEFDEQIRQANVALQETIPAAIAAETAQIIAFIEGLPPEIDTSALTGVVANLNTVSTQVSGVFEPPAPA